MNNQSHRSSHIIKIILFLYFLVPISCLDEKCEDSCCGAPSELEYTKIDSLTLAVGSIDMYQGNGYDIVDFSSDKSTSYLDAAIFIEVFDIQFAADHGDGVNSTGSFSLLNQAYACSPPEPIPTQLFESITIVSDRPVVVNDTTFESGVDLSHLFYFPARYSDRENQSVDDYIEEQNQMIQYPQGGFGYYKSNMLLQLNTNVVLPQQTLTFRIEFEDGAEFVLSTDEFVIE